MTNYIPHITEALQRGTLALFVGGDLAAGVTGLPGRSNLARGLARRHGLGESDSLAAVAQQVGQRFEIVSYLRDQLDTTGKQPQPFHRRVVELVQRYGVATVLTTAYDDLLKRAFQDARAGLSVVVGGGEVVFVQPRTPALIRLYGDLGQVDTLVVTEDDHYRLWRDREKEALLDEVRAALTRNAVLFLGYNLADPDFNLLWREALDKAGRLAIGVYAAWPGATEGQKRVWADRQVRVLEVPALDLLGALLGEPQARDERQGLDERQALDERQGLDERQALDERQKVANGRAGPAEAAPSPPAPAPLPDARPDRVAAIRDLPREAFTAQTLGRFCDDRPLFRPIVGEFGPGQGLNDMVDEVVTYCRTHRILDELLAEVKAVNSRQYDWYLRS